MVRDFRNPQAIPVPTRHYTIERAASSPLGGGPHGTRAVPRIAEARGCPMRTRTTSGGRGVDLASLRRDAGTTGWRNVRVDQAADPCSTLRLDGEQCAHVDVERLRQRDEGADG